MLSRNERRWILFLLLILISVAAALHAESANSLQLSADASQHFSAAHGQRAVVMGYPKQGLEVWAYPLQLISRYQVGFRPAGASSEVEGSALLRRVITQPESITRIYAGPDYIVREKLFVPVDQPVAVLSYEIESARPVAIVVHFQPVLDLMWPAAIGGQSAAWMPSLHGYYLEEPTHRFAAVVASPEAGEHDEPGNSTVRVAPGLSFILHPQGSSGRSEASVYIGAVSPAISSKTSSLAQWEQAMPAWAEQAHSHYDQLLKTAIHLETPDERLNSAFTWAEIALDQAWVCNEKLGCGVIAGYGPSRPGRRPQYDWFFAGDGMIAADALIAAGEYQRARQELEFIQKYQDPRTGMIWHELSQSAGYIDWLAYPYMYVHVDLSFDYLNVLHRYVTASGDNRFAAEHWSSILAAYRYCRSILHEDHLPHIPADKEGGDEQHRPDDDLNLSSAWISAAESFAELARITNHNSEAEAAIREARLAKQSFASRYWSQAANTWIDGHTADGKPILGLHSGSMSGVLAGAFTPHQSQLVLQQLASARYQTDWGTRSASTDSPIFNPWSYSTGSVSAIHSADIARGFWMEGEPVTAWPVLEGLLTWNMLDSPGHLHEVLAGNFYREQSESVPEQTWSSAGMVSAVMDGLLGMGTSGTNLTLRPALPPDWHEVTIDHVPVASGRVAIALSQDESTAVIKIAQVTSPFHLDYAPALPLGAQIDGAECNGHSVHAELKTMLQVSYGHLDFNVVGATDCRVHFHGGVAILMNPKIPQLGDASTGLKVKAVELQGSDLRISVDVPGEGDRTFCIRTSWRITGAEGARMQYLGNRLYQVTIAHPAGDQDKNSGRDGYVEAALQIHFAKR